MASATLWTCFWAGDTFAPKVRIGGMGVQEFLQTAFLDAWIILARAVGDLEGVLGFEVRGALPDETGLSHAH
jgi:hypothetical protein